MNNIYEKAEKLANDIEEFRLSNIQLLSKSVLVPNHLKDDAWIFDVQAVTGKVNELPLDVPGNELSYLWPQIGFLDDGMIVFNSKGVCFNSILAKNRKTNEYKHTMQFTAEFYFIDKKHNMLGHVQFGHKANSLEALFQHSTPGGIAVKLARSDFFTKLWEADEVGCPELGCDPRNWRVGFHHVIEHLNDEHDYSFKQLANWLKTINAKPRVLPVYSTNNKYLGEIFEDYRRIVNNPRPIAPGQYYYKNYYTW